MRGAKVPQLDAMKRKKPITQPDIIQIILSRTRAKNLLEHAKLAVEIAIEQDEQAAINALASVVDAPLE